MASNFTKLGNPGCGCCTSGTTCSSFSLCWQLFACAGFSGQSITIVDPVGGSHTSSSNPFCLSGTLHTGNYTYTSSATGYYTRTGDIYTFSCDASHTIDVNLTPTSIPVHVVGCSDSTGLPGCVVTMSGGYTGTCTTDGSGNCTLPLSNALSCTDTWTVTVTGPDSRWATLTQSGSCSCATDAIGCTGPCFLNLNLNAAEGFSCCPNSCEPICNTYIFSTPFGTCTATIGLTGLITCVFTVSVMGWPNVFVSGSTYARGCSVLGVVRGMVDVTFTVTYNPCVGTLSITYNSCGTDCSTQNATEDLPSGGSYAGLPITTTCTYSGTAICPPSATSGGYTVGGTGYLNGIYSATEDCGAITTTGGGGSVGMVEDYPSLLSRAVSLASAVVDHISDGGRKASPEVQAEREEICRGCDQSEKDATACRACGCGVIGALNFIGLDMVEKRSWASSRCPLKSPKWDQV